MGKDARMGQDATTDFFISYVKADRAWAEWIAWQLEDKGFATILQDWDVRPGHNVVLERDRAAQRAARTIAVLSPDYFDSPDQQAEWSAALAQDLASKGGRLLPVRVRDFQPRGLFASIEYINLVGRDEAAARAALLAGIEKARAKPAQPPSFPGKSAPEPAPAFPGTWPEIWNVPYQRNPFFTGREELLTRLHDQLFANGAAALSQPRAISGLGGIGKTQSAIEYAYRHGHEYRYVLWALADSRESLLTAYSAIAALVHAPGYDERDQRGAVPAVKTWLAQHANWLLILDNADDIALAAEFLPSSAGCPGHILLTTRAQATGAIARCVAVEKMGQREGEALLLKRSKARERGGRISKEERRATAAIVKEMDGLPLALAQAGAYIEENDSNLVDYWRLYQQRRKDLLAWRSELVRDYPASVATAWDLAFRRIEQENSAAADLLRLCAFLAPDAIPEEIISEGAEHLGEHLAPVATDEYTLDAAIRLLLRYSLAQRDSKAKTLTLHRLMQAVVQDSLDEEGQRLWAERAVEAVNAAFSYRGYETIIEFERFLPHVMACARRIAHFKLASLAAWRLLNNAGTYLRRYRHTGAEAFSKLALAMARQVFGEQHINTAAALHNLAWHYMEQERYDDAVPLFLQALRNYYNQDSETMGQPLKAHYMAATLNGLGELYRKQQHYQGAEAFYNQALRMQQKALGITHPDTAMTLNNLALLYKQQGNERYPQAEALYRRALDILERGRDLGAEPAQIATTQYNLARLCYEQGRYEEAEALYKEALRTREKVLGPEHPDTIRTMREYADLLRVMGREGEAAALEARSGRG
jgi:tetratricopeptide (TPR) repeat protein